MGEQPSVFGEDALVKDDALPKSKYSNDYSRFEEVEEEPDAPVKDDRNYYFDEKGEVVYLDDAKPAAVDENAEEAFAAEMQNVLKAAGKEKPGGSDIMGGLEEKF